MTEQVEMRHFGRYEILRELGRGGQAHVYLARDPDLNRKIALKVLSEDRLAGGSSVERLRREAELASKLDHPSICTVYEAGQLDGRPYLAMQYVDGASFAQLVDEARTREGARPASLRKAVAALAGRGAQDGARGELDYLLELFAKAARALHAAHEIGLVHRDVKPGNLLVSRKGEPMIVDFGLARDEDSDLHTLTKTGEFMGTPAYMSPEQLAGRGDGADRRTDVYSLAATLYEALTLERPHEGETWEALCERVLVGTPPDPRRVDPSLPKDLARVVERALEKDPAHRYATALAFAEDLERVGRREPIAAARLSISQRLERWVRRDRRRATLVGAALLVALASGGTLAILRLSGDSSDAAAPGASDLASAMDSVRGVLPQDSFDAAQADVIRDRLNEAASGLPAAEAEDLRRWVVGSLLGFTGDFPRDDRERWPAGAAAEDGYALWALLADLDPSQFESVQGSAVAKVDAPPAPPSPRDVAAREWAAMETEDYVVNFMPREGEKGEIAREVARELQVLSDQGLDRVLARHERKRRPEERHVVRVFHDEQAFREFGAPQGAEAVWSRPRGELGLLVRIEDGERANIRAARAPLFGQSALQRTQLELEGEETPPWLSDGLCDVFTSATVDGDEVRVAVNTSRERVLEKLSGEPLAALEVMKTDRARLYRDHESRAQAWALAYFLTQVTPREEWKELPARLLREDPKAREDPALALSDVDWKALDSAYQTWLKTIR